MDTNRFKVPEVRPGLAAHLEKSVESVPLVRTVHFDPDASHLIVEHDGADLNAVVAALREEGFSSSRLDASSPNPPETAS